MRKTIDRILILACVLLAGPLAAQQDDAPPPDEPAAPAEEPIAGEDQEPAADRETPPPSPDTFDPSEEISLDLPVSFPVDI